MHLLYAYKQANQSTGKRIVHNFYVLNDPQGPLQAFSTVVSRTVVKELTSFQLTQSVARSLTIAEPVVGLSGSAL